MREHRNFLTHKRGLKNDHLAKVLSLMSEEKIQINIEALCESPLSIDTFNFYSSVSSVYSSKIEGEEIEMDSFIKHKRYGVQYLPDYTKKVDDLYDAYEYAKIHPLSLHTINEAHGKITQNILKSHQRGSLRSGMMYVLTKDGKIEYVAIDAVKLKEELKLWSDDLEYLLKADLSRCEVIYYASFLHLTLLKIHPFEDGNGRISRLVEKWFLASKLGAKAWFLPTERYYYDHLNAYYKSIRKLGIEYDYLDYNEADDFILLLYNSIVSEITS